MLVEINRVTTKAYNPIFLGLLIAWTWSIIWNTPPLIFWDGYDSEGLGSNCAPNWFVKEYG